MNQDKKLLVTGEFWHTDFADLIGRVEIPTALIPTERLALLTDQSSDYCAVLIAQSRRGSIKQEFVEHCRELFPATPIAVLQGSWCEGESRSGKPLQSVMRLYWHEWNGSYQSLATRLAIQCVPLSKPSSRWPIELMEKPPRPCTALNRIQENICIIGVSALTRCQFETLEGPIQELEATAVWIEQTAWHAATPKDIQAICVDSDGLNEALGQRLELVRESVPGAPIVLTMNFPRKHEAQELREKYDVRAIVSKPFDLYALWQGLNAAGLELKAPNIIPIAPTIAVGSPISMSERPTLIAEVDS